MTRQEVIDFIKKQFDITEEHLWLKFPDYIVFRNRKNKKWFAIIMDIEKSRLGLEDEGSLLHNEGYLPAYHMSKKNWITVLLDGSVSENELKDLICLSYEIIDNIK